MGPVPQRSCMTDTAATEDQADQARMIAAMARATAAAQDEVLALRRALAQAETMSASGHKLAQLQQGCAELERECDRLKARADHFETLYNAVIASSSWRLTAPLRRVMSALRGASGKAD